MSKISLKDYLCHPSGIVFGILNHCWFLFSDKVSLKIQYRIRMGRRLDLRNPKRYTEKQQWLKLYDRKPEYTIMVDKIAAKDYVARKIGDQYIIPTIGSWQHFDEIDFDLLPERFVLKTNHGGGGNTVVFCKNKLKFNKKRAKAILEKSLEQSIYHNFREWPYKNVKPMIFAEQLMENSGTIGLMDYKFYCFNGIPKVLLIASNRFTTHNFNYFDMDFQPLPITSVDGMPIDEDLITRPQSFEEMKSVAKVLSRNIPHVRVDLYEIDGKVFFGELTFFDSSGFDNLNSDSVDLEWGSWITLPSKSLS